MAEDMSYAESPVQSYWSGYEMTRDHYPSRDGSRTWTLVQVSRDGFKTRDLVNIVRANDHGAEWVLVCLDGAAILPMQSYQDRTDAWLRAIDLFEAGQLPIKP